ncbi:MAG TPA: hypothetical protein VJC03_03225, partial [bacterium]|nr:hypothetical protein [bacterium]
MAKIVGIDIDGVLADTAGFFLDRVHQYLGKRFHMESVTEYFFEDCLDLTVKEVEEVWRRMTEEGKWEKIPLIKGVKESILPIQSKFPLHIITARPQVTEGATKIWLEKHGIRYASLIFANLDTKVDFLKKYNLQLTHFIEDRWDFALEFSGHGIEVLLLDQP